MKFLALLLALFLSIVSASANLGHGGSKLGHVARHVSIAQRQTATLVNKPRKRCINRPSSTGVSNTLTSTRTTDNLAAAVTTTKHTTTNPAVAGPTTTSKAGQIAIVNNNGSTSGSSGGKIVNLQGPCGNSRASAKTSKYTGPNGSIDWLNCGIDGKGWTPPKLTLKEAVFKSLDEALAMPNSPFQACKAYIPLFKLYGEKTGIPPIMIASFAFQESSCRPWIVGGGGEQGLMQITEDKCGGAPDKNCRDPDFNIRTGTQYFASRLHANGGNLLTSIGEYNGWSVGMTFAQATHARYTACCRCQNNLDYLHDILNVWCQGINPDGGEYNKYNNLAVCSQKD